MIDFSEPGELEVFIDEQQVSALEKKMQERGYLEGSEMATTFNMLRANDLIWSFVVNNYLLGKDPFPFDLLYWNSDSTRMPAAMHSFYLRNMYINNLLRKPGGITLNGVPIDLTEIKVPLYFVSTLEDHIAPWKSTYTGAQLFKSKVRFVLGGSGHIAGIVNPPAAQQVRLLDQRRTRRDAAGMARQRNPASGFVVDRLGEMGRSVCRRQSARAYSGQRQAEGARRCARLIREVEARREESRRVKNAGRRFRRATHASDRARASRESRGCRTTKSFRRRSGARCSAHSSAAVFARRRYRAPESDTVRC